MIEGIKSNVNVFERLMIQYNLKENSITILLAENRHQVVAK